MIDPTCEGTANFHPHSSNTRTLILYATFRSRPMFERISKIKHCGRRKSVRDQVPKSPLYDMPMSNVQQKAQNPLLLE